PLGLRPATLLSWRRCQFCYSNSAVLPVLKVVFNSTDAQFFPMAAADQLRAALEANDCEQLLKLCRQLDSNLKVSSGKFKNPPHTREMSVTHHVASKPYGLDCLEVLIDRFGAACLTCRDEFNYTPVHWAAMEQSQETLQLIHVNLSSDCFYEKGRFGRSVFHCAAVNEHSNKALEWLIGELGSDSLMEKDDNGSTVVHLAAQFQSSDSMDFIKSKLGSDCFRQKGWLGRTAVHWAACNKVSNSSLKWLINELGLEALMKKDDIRLTVCHLVAVYQGEYSMDLMKGLLGIEIFHLRDRFDQTAAHFAAQNTGSNATLAWCVRELSSQCLTQVDRDGDTPVHCAAQHQDEKSMQLVVSSLGPDCLKLPGDKQRTAVHFAAINTNSVSALRWIVGQLGADCLKLRDDEGVTSAHLAAQHQGEDSLRLIRDSLGVAAFDLQDRQGQSVADYAKKNSRSERMLGCIAELREEERLREAMEDSLLQRSSPEGQQDEAPASLDPSFSSWTFLPDAAGYRQLIGEGGFGKVYKAFTDRQQTVAVKIVEPIRCSDPSKLETAVEQERRGFEILVRIRHRNIVQFLKTERSAEHGFCIFTELIAGCSLLDLMNRLNKPFDEPAVRRFSHQICRALNFLHCEHIVHRDIKCSNIMLTHEGVIKLIDFGLAKEIVSAAQGAATYTLGTVHFMAAELLLDDENDRLVYTPKTDVWAFGCTVFEMLESRPPNSDVNPMRIPHRVTSRDMPQLPDRTSDTLRDFYRLCVMKEPGERADTAELLRHSFLQSW
ncbi:hypothetical protein BOX15_Mlig007832g1, partial [Macrostomum lignano]